MIPTNEKMIIAIDGMAGSGKSTLAKALAKAFGYLLVDTGAMYRAVTWKALQKKIDLTDEGKLSELAKSSVIELKTGKDYTEPVKVFIDGQDITKEIRSTLVSNHVSEVAKVKGVRECMVEHQRKIGSKGGVVLEGRDIGTVVFPSADIKFFLDASVEKRASRRHKEVADTETTVTVDHIKENLQQRDQIDSSREHSPLKIAPDAIVIDTTNDSVDEMVQKVLDILDKRLNP